MQLWASRFATATGFEEMARRAEEAGWDGITVTDSQNLSADPFVAIALGARATEQLRFATGVTNAHTRHPAALATVAASVQEVSGGRFTLGIGRGDTALFHLGLPPMPVNDFVARTTEVQTYLSGEAVDCDGFDSRLHWLGGSDAPKVPLDVAASGPRMIDFAARRAEQVTFAVGADPERLEWALDEARTAAADADRDPSTISFGAYLNIGCHPDRDTARDLIRGPVAAFTHFSAMPGSTGEGVPEKDRELVAAVGRTYDSKRHLRNDSPQTEVLEDDYIDRFGVVGSPDECAERIQKLATLGLERFVLIGAALGADRDEARLSNRLLATELLPALKPNA